jgi:hypothetical protein
MPVAHEVKNPRLVKSIVWEIGDISSGIVSSVLFSRVAMFAGAKNE